MRKLGRVVSEIVIACAVFYGSGTTVLADGCYFPDIAVKKLPEIPTQRALLTWKDGTETLVIASALDSEAQKLGWLIPLPAVPTEMAKTDPGALKTLSFCIQPRITHDLSRAARALTLAVGWVLLAAVIAAFWERFLVWFLVITLPLMFGGLLLPRLGAARASVASVANVRVEKTAKVGAYDIAVLTVGGAAELNRWLTDNGLTPLPVAAEPMVADYVRRGWKFVAIKLTRAESGSSTPHPIKLVFPSREAVYPWKLTTLAGGKPFLELFVVGTQRAETGGLETEFCDRFRPRKHPAYYGKEGNDSQEYAPQAAAVRIAHPGTLPMLWDGCVLTKLSGYLDAQRITDDLHVRWTEFVPYQQHFYTSVAAGYVAWMVFVSVLGGICVIGLLVFGKRVKEPDGRSFCFLKLVPSAMVSAAAPPSWSTVRRSFLKLVPSAMVAALSVAAVTYFVLPKLRTTDVQVMRRGHLMEMVFPGTLHKAIRSILGGEPTLKEKNEQMIADAILDRLPDAMPWRQLADKAHVLNELQGGNVQIESSPGNFTIEKRDGKIIVYVYDGTGYPVTAEY